MRKAILAPVAETAGILGIGHLRQLASSLVRRHARRAREASNGRLQRPCQREAQRARFTHRQALRLTNVKRYGRSVATKRVDKSDTGDKVNSPNTKEGKTLAFTAVAIKPEDKPAPGKRGGRASNVPAIEQFLQSITEPGTYEMRSPDEDGGHPVNRIAQIRKAAGEAFKVETSPIESGKRYRVFVTLS